MRRLVGLALGLLACALCLVVVNANRVGDSGLMDGEEDIGQSPVRMLIQLAEAEGHETRYQRTVQSMLSALKSQAADDTETVDEEEATDESEDETEVSEGEEADEESAGEAEEESDSSFVELGAGGEWKDPPVWWKAPEEEMANADQQPWPLDPNFPMSVLDPPPNLPLANIEDPNNYPPMADPNMAFNIDPSAFPQTNEKVGTDDQSFASFSINGR